MAKLINVSASTEERMTSGERRVASRLESFLNDDCLVWYDIPVGRRNRHPDFVIIDPENGLYFWRSRTGRFPRCVRQIRSRLHWKPTVF